MRFFANGPSIPNELLQLRDQGEVVFFCGAGVSKPAGLPDFPGLTKAIITKLGVPETSKRRILFEQARNETDPEFALPLDQVFGLLQREYTPSRVEAEVAKQLKTPSKADVSYHDIVLRLSSDIERKPFVVTTNFDLLFERARKGLQRWAPPMLPDMSGDQNHHGVVYLHGRLSHAQREAFGTQGLVLGSGDFGRAYLADGWATRFFRQLLERRVVVLLGYSAGDPPVRYLLEGLHASISAKLRTIYAFDRGEASEVRAKWRDLGITGITYNRYEQLWQTLSAWAQRADNPEIWKAGVVKLAQRPPRTLQPYERGQVAAMVATIEGAKMFANANPVPSAEWLCVFDNFVRYQEPNYQGWGENVIRVDPMAEYGLDDDPPCPKRTGVREQIEGVDLLATLPEDEQDQSYERRSGVVSRGSRIDSHRLRILSTWFEHIAHEPAAIWWALRQHNLHPDLTWGVSRRLEGHGHPFRDQVWRIWSLLLEIKDEKPDNVYDWYKFRSALDRDGWTPRTLRQFEKTIRPRLCVENPTGRAKILPPAFNGEDDLRTLIKFEVYFPSRHGEEIEVGKNVLPEVFKIVRRCLEHAISLLSDTDAQARIWHLPAIEPDDRPGDRYFAEDGIAEHFLWAVSLFDRLAENYPTMAKRESDTWPDPDVYFFDKFRIHAWRKSALFSGDVVANGIMNLPEESFWNPCLARELLHLLRDRWADLSCEARSRLEGRILSGRTKHEFESPDEYADHKAYIAGSWFGWLERNECRLSQAAPDTIATFRSWPGWQQEWEDDADRDMDGRSDSIERRRDPGNLTSVRLGEILSQAEQQSGRDHDFFVEYAPFDGLVRENPFRALSALSLEARRGSYPLQYWTRLLAEWPDGTSERLRWLLGHRIARLPNQELCELRHFVTAWINKHLATLEEAYSNDFWPIWDAVFEGLMSGGADATKSDRDTVRVGGEIKQQSRRTLNHALSSPIGKMVEALFSSLGKRQLQIGEGLPTSATQQLERAMNAVGEGAGHAVSIIMRRLNWLDQVDPNWVRGVLLPVFNLSSPQSVAAWSSFLLNVNVPQSVELFDLIKPDFLSLINQGKDWMVEASLDQQAAKFLIIATFWNRHDRRYLTSAECRTALQTMNDAGRHAALWTLDHIVSKQGAWSSFGKRFFREIWPQEARFQTSGTSDAMIRIAENNPDKFPEIVKAIRDYLRPSEHPDMFLHRAGRKPDEDGQATLAERWPRQVLDIAGRIIPEDSQHVPHGLAGLLERIAESDPAARKQHSWRRLHELVAK